MTRQTITQQAPMPGSNLQLVPVAEYQAGSEFYRAHRQEHGPWYFSSSMQGRFGLPEPEGTCYLALTPAAAVREVLGARLSQSRRIPQSLVAGRIISRLPLPASSKTAQVSHDDAFLVGITGELTTMPSYKIPQAWAAAFGQAGFQGITYRPRFSPGNSLALALFGPTGPADLPSNYETSLADAATSLGLELYATGFRNLYTFATFTESD